MLHSRPLAVKPISTRRNARQRDAEAAVALARSLGRGTAGMQEMVEETLANWHRANPLPFIDWMMGLDAPEQTVAAVRVLRLIANPDTLPLLRELARSSSAPLRAEALRAIAAATPSDRVSASAA